MNQAAIIYESKVSSLFKVRLIELCEQMRLDPNYLMACIAFETGMSFSPACKNLAGSGAVGLIQFMPDTAKYLGTSTEELLKMTAEQQLDYVAKYFKPYAVRLKTLSDYYMAILFPRAIGRSEDYILFETPAKAYTQNKGLDLDKDGKITKGEASQPVVDYYNRGVSNIVRRKL